MFFLYYALFKTNRYKNLCLYLPTAIKNRNFKLSVKLLDLKLYDTLQITQKATQSEIKVAYYKLSMLYHPDKNKGSEEASQKFRDISAAYEVLGNFKLRKLYDKGVIHTDPKYSQFYDAPVEDDPQTKFYKQHMDKSKTPPATGRTPIYDFDEWSRNHYGAAFERRQAAKQRYDVKYEKELSDQFNNQKTLIIFLITLFVSLYFGFVYEESKLDQIRKSKNLDKTKS